MSRTIVIGDIHGCFDELISLLDLVGLKPGDRVVTVGDLITKGPKSRDRVNSSNWSGHGCVCCNRLSCFIIETAVFVSVAALQAYGKPSKRPTKAGSNSSG